MLAAIVATPCDGQVEADPDFQAPIEEARGAVPELLGRIPGGAVAVGVGPRLVWSEGFGYADIEGGTAVEPNTIFRIFSLSKVLTGVALMRLAQAGRVDLDRPISTLLHELPPDVGAATPRQLAGHIGGIRHYRDGEAWNQRHCETPRDALAIFGSDGSVDEPGSTYRYTSWGYALLSRVLEAAGGLPFGELIDREVLKPARMSSTLLGTGIERSRTTTFYERSGFLRKRNRPAREVDISCKWGGGAFLSTADDMARLGMALMGGQLLEPDPLDTFLTEMRTDEGERTGYAMGLGLSVDAEGRTCFTHTGSGVGGRSAIILCPDVELVVVTMANNREEAIVEWAATVARSFLDEVRRAPD